MRRWKVYIDHISHQPPAPRVAHTINYSSLDLLDRLDVKVADVAAVEVVVASVEAAPVRVPEALCTDLTPSACREKQKQNVLKTKRVIENICTEYIWSCCETVLTRYRAVCHFRNMDEISFLGVWL